MTNGIGKAIPGQEDLIDHIIASKLPITSVLDIGAGNGFASLKLSDAGYKVTATGFDVTRYATEATFRNAGVSLLEDVDICKMDIFPDHSFDAVWCSHVLEHVLNTGLALDEIRRVLKPDGYLFISVPPFKHNVVGGHVKPGWNLGILLYVLAIAGFNTKHGAFVRHGYNICAIVRKLDKPTDLEKLRFAGGDLEILDRLGFAPEGVDLVQNMDGNISNINWTWHITPIFNPENRSREIISESVLLRSLAPRVPAEDVSLRQLARTIGDCIPDKPYTQMIEQEYIQSVLPNSREHEVLELTSMTRSFGRDIVDHNGSINCAMYKLPLSQAAQESTDPAFSQLKLPFESEQFDYIYIHHVFNFLESPHALLSEVYRVLKPHGEIFGSISHLEPPHYLSIVNYTPLGWRNILAKHEFKSLEFTAGIDGLSAILHRFTDNKLLVDKPFRYSALNRSIDGALSQQGGSQKMLNLMKVVYAGKLYFRAKKNQLDSSHSS